MTKPVQVLTNNSYKTMSDQLTDGASDLSNGSLVKREADRSGDGLAKVEQRASTTSHTGNCDSGSSDVSHTNSESDLTDELANIELLKHEIDDNSDDSDAESTKSPNPRRLHATNDDPSSTAHRVDKVSHPKDSHIRFVQRRMFLKAQQEPAKRFKNGTRMSMHFTNDRMCEIDRSNKILLKKIINSGPSAIPPPAPVVRDNNDRSGSGIVFYPTGSAKSSAPSSRVTSATINRRKQQERIAHENQLLLRKLQKYSGKK